MPFRIPSRATTALCTVVVSGILAAWFLLSPTRAGETRASPDGKFIAEAGNIERWNLGLRKERYLEVVVRSSDGTLLWNVILNKEPGVDVADFSVRQQFITWGNDSSEVTVLLADKQRITLRVSDFSFQGADGMRKAQ